MSTLRDRLADLAAIAEDPSAGPGPAAELWARGDRYRRRRRAGTLVVLASTVLALLALTTYTWHRGAPPAQPASGTAGLPDRLFEPSPWLHGTADDGPPGRLAAILSTERATTSDRGLSVLGVSASTGTYRFLDLPGAMFDGDLGTVALAPDGRHVAYWQLNGPAVYDTVTGEVQTNVIDARFGVQTLRFVWAGSDILTYPVQVNLDGTGTTSVARPPQLWRLGVEPRDLDVGGEVVAGADGLLLVDADPGLRVVDAGTGEIVDTFASEQLQAGPLLSPDGSTYAAIVGDQVPGPVAVGGVEVPGAGPASQLVGWADADHLAVLTRPVGSADVVLVDVRDGSTEPLVRDVGAQAAFARDLLGEPTVAAVRPPSPVDPRLLSGGVVGVAVAALVALLWWRRRVRT